MFKKIAIANRGEIAMRIYHAANELGIKTVALYSSADSNLMHIKLADEAICIGGSSVKESYLNSGSIIEAAKMCKADAIHPGYGFFAENAEFAQLVIDNGLVFIGPDPETTKLMEDKISARNIMTKYGIPCVPGTLSALTEEGEENFRIAEELGYPVVIKSAHGGGGRAMHVAYKSPNLLNIINLTKAEAKSDFGSSDVYMEKFIENPRHIEIQIISDGNGHAVHLGDRDCSTQRWNKKVIEESPSVGISIKQREEIGKLCVLVCEEIKYKGVGTFEFLYEDGVFYFVEMNTRVQVGHTVTELVTGIDLIKEQIKIAAGEKMLLKQSDINIKGHSIECRIYAEDPRTFVASYGKITLFHAPGGPGVRVDSHIYTGYDLPSYYDPLIVKIITHGDDRVSAINRMLCALDELVVKGVKTNISLHQAILSDPDFLVGKFLLNHLEKKLGPK